MSKSENTSTESRPDVIMLGVASVETKGEGIGFEAMGDEPPQGISDK